MWVKVGTLCFSSSFSSSSSFRRFEPVRRGKCQRGAWKNIFLRALRIANVSDAAETFAASFSAFSSTASPPAVVDGCSRHVAVPVRARPRRTNGKSHSRMKDAGNWLERQTSGRRCTEFVVGQRTIETRPRNRGGDENVLPVFHGFIRVP